MSEQPTLSTEGDKLEGFLLKQGAKGIRKSFKKRWFALQTNRLYYYHNKGDTQSIGFIDIMLASSIIPSGKTSEFQILTPGRVFTLVAATDQEMKGWVNALNNHRQRLIKQSREAASGGDPSGGGLLGGQRRQSIGNPMNVGSASPTTKKPARTFHTIGPRGRVMTDTVTVAAGSEDRKSMWSSGGTPTTPSTETATATSTGSGSEWTGSRPTERRKSNADIVSEELCGENQKLQMRLDRTERDLENRIEMVNELKSTVVKELKALEEKHKATETEMQKLRDEVVVAKQKIAELEVAKPAATGEQPAGEQAAAAWTAATPTEGGVAESGGDNAQLLQQLQAKDAVIEEQNKHIETLKAKLEVRIEEEATRMKEKVKLTMEKLRSEHEEQLRKNFAGGRSVEEWKKLEQDLLAQNTKLVEDLQAAQAQIAALTKQGV